MQQDQVFRDLLFRQKRKKGKWRAVKPPELPCAVADTHAHLGLLSDPAANLARCSAYGVNYICSIVDIFEDDLAVFQKMGEWQAESAQALREFIANSAMLSDPMTDVSGSEVVPLEYCRNVDAAACEVPEVCFAVGCHPHNAEHYDDALEARLLEQLRDPRVKAIGEIGLDYHYDFSPREDQREAFRRQIRLAHKTGLPVALHLREAHDEALAIMEEEGFPKAGVLLHCFNLDWETLEPWAQRGVLVAFGGQLTFKSFDYLRQACANLPLDQIVLETDSPYMTPEPMRGTTCGPEHVIFTADVLCQVRGAEGEHERAKLLEQIMGNARRFLDHPPAPIQMDAPQGMGDKE